MIRGYRHMCVRRRPQAQGSLHKDLPRRATQEVRAPYDIGDALSGIVDDDGQLVGKQAIATPDHEIADLGADGDGR